MRLRRLAVVAILGLTGLLFVQPLRASRDAEQKLRAAQTELAQARVEKRRAILENRALNTRAKLVQEARSRGYVFPGETPFVIPQPTP